MSEEVKKTRSKKYEIDNVEVEVEEEQIEEKKEHPILMRICLTIGAIFILFCIYSFIICPSLLKVREYKVESNLLPSSFDEIKIVQLADIHYGTTINKKQLDKIVKRINELNPDIIFFTGDLIDKNIVPTETIQEEIIESLKNLNCSLYKYAVIGNEDDQETFNNLMEQTNFIVLNNETKLLYYKDKTPIAITGFNNISSNPVYSEINNPIDDIDVSTLYHIVIFHESDAIDSILEYNPNLVLSSATLGGKINFIKPLFLPDTADKYYDEYYRLNETDLYVSNGLGTTGVNLRFNNVPSFNFYRLYKEEN
ncbi:MAG: metallophosphoesterase [Bacilli bacterium]|nr:metallophosphoesterase [Bacilli bacterium]